MLPQEGTLLRIMIGESDKRDGMPLYEWIVREARQAGLAGATVTRGLSGYGANSVIHRAKILELSTDLPILIEIVDSPERIETFLPVLDEAVQEGLVTEEPVRVHFYRGRKA